MPQVETSRSPGNLYIVDGHKPITFGLNFDLIDFSLQKASDLVVASLVGSGKAPVAKPSHNQERVCHPLAGH